MDAPDCLQIDYGCHPAFAPYATNQQIDTAAIDEVFKEVDTHFRLLVSTPEALPAQFVRRYFARQMEPLFSELLTVVLEIAGKECWYYPYLPKIFTDTKSALMSEAIYRNENKLYKPLDHPNGKEVAESGAAFLRIPKEEIEKIWQSVQIYRPEVCKIKEEAPWEVASLPLPHQGSWWELTNDLLRRSGALAILSHLHGCLLEPLNCAFMFSQSTDEWYKGCYADMGLPNSKTTYMHLDHAYQTPKMILYLVDVDEDKGPFAIVPHSKSVTRSYSQLVMWKFTDWHMDPAANNNPKFKANHRRKRYLFPELRKELMRLPNQLRGSSHFGEDIQNDTPFSNLLLQKEVVCPSDRANCILFDGGSTFHRGGLVKNGERWAFQMGFKRVSKP